MLNNISNTEYAELPPNLSYRVQFYWFFYDLQCIYRNLNVRKTNNCRSQFLRMATFRTLQKVQIEIAMNDSYDAGLCLINLSVYLAELNDVFVAGLPGLVPVYQ